MYLGNSKSLSKRQKTSSTRQTVFENQHACGLCPSGLPCFRDRSETLAIFKFIRLLIVSLQLVY